MIPGYGALADGARISALVWSGVRWGENPSLARGEVVAGLLPRRRPSLPWLGFSLPTFALESRSGREFSLRPPPLSPVLGKDEEES